MPRRMIGIGAAVLLAVMAFLMPQAAMANAKYGSIVIDAHTGEVLSESRADRKLYPASLTKMMTLYLTFEAVRSGRLQLDQKIKVSANAAAEPRSKLGLRKGSSIRVRDAIRACAVKSANDAATALGEAIAGSEVAFAELMTRKAKSLGMTNTRFANAHGLTNSRQKSSPRDMSVLARRLWADFPEYYWTFKRKSFQYGGRTLRATNKLLSRYPGADGIKTGYTRASGYNLASSAVRGQDRLIAVVFGGKSSSRRDRHISKLMDEGFAELARRKAQFQISAVAFVSPIPKRRPAAATVASAPNASAVAALRARDTDAAIQAMRRLDQVASLRAAPSQTPQTARLVAAPPRAVRPAGPWAVQIGAYRSRKGAETILRKAQQLRPSVLQSTVPTVSRRVAGGRPMYRALFVGLDRKDEARTLCRNFKARGIDCLALRTGS